MNRWAKPTRKGKIRGYFEHLPVRDVGETRLSVCPDIRSGLQRIHSMHDGKPFRAINRNQLVPT
ncbi:hypothetical protein DXV75_12770 [Alteromonas aestuariivivens]|uniref:Uncharacterized protein n=1 Tax=Alteromonas aestuariivivens TaxID=1938339 RepID=A0A3D8M4F2_9ALTE|nr:hypothetical protein DXV75_12770 [Alteromonas aestuariivivens]